MRKQVTIQQILERVSTKELDRVEAKVRAMRETFAAPASIPDEASYQRELFRFYAHYFKCFFRGPELDMKEARVMGWDELQRWYKNVDLMSRDAVLNRNGGFIRIVDTMTDAIIKQHIALHIENVIDEHVPSYCSEREQLAEEFMAFVRKTFPFEEYPTYLFAYITDLPKLIREYALQMHSISSTWRW